MVLARAPERDRDQEPRDPRVKQDIARGQHGSDGRGHGDHVSQERQNIGIGHLVMLQIVADPHRCRRACRMHGRRADRHSAVRHHHGQIHPQPHQDQPGSGEPTVDRYEYQQEGVRPGQRHHG